MNQFLKKLLIFVIPSVCSVVVFAGPIHTGPCSTVVQFESYAYGINFGFTQKDTNLRFVDQYCFSLGQSQGKYLFDKYQSSSLDLASCQDSYQTAYQQGLNADIQVVDNDQDCSNAGYTFGEARLTTGARDGNSGVVGDSCVQAYQQGFADGNSHESHGSYSTNQDRACYSLGLSEGQSRFQ